MAYLGIPGMLREGSLADLAWLSDAVTFDASEMKAPTSGMVEAVAFEWGRHPDDILHSVAPSLLEKQKPQVAASDIRAAVHFARTQMLRGRTGKMLGLGLRQRFAQPVLREAFDPLRQLLAGDGLLGVVVVDAAGFGSCREALAATTKSPYRRFLAYIVNCQCDHQHEVVDASGLESADGSEAGAIDGFLAAERQTAPTKQRLCPLTQLRIIGSCREVEAQVALKLLSDLQEQGKLSQADVDRISGNPKWTPAQVVMAAVRLARLRAAEAQARQVQSVVIQGNSNLRAELRIEVDTERVTAPLDVSASSAPAKMKFGESRPVKPVKIADKLSDMAVEVEPERQVAALEVDPQADMRA